MYNLVIIDDEKRARNIIANYIEKLNIGFKETRCFEDGKNALEYVNNNDIDVVITDIKIPNMNGLEFCQALRRTNNECFLIIVSGFAEFEYAQEAINYNVEGYLIKPIDIFELKKYLLSIRDKLETRKSAETTNDDSIKEQFLTDLIKNSLNENEIKHIYNLLNFKLPYEKSKGWKILMR